MDFGNVNAWYQNTQPQTCSEALPANFPVPNSQLTLNEPSAGGLYEPSPGNFTSGTAGWNTGCCWLQRSSVWFGFSRENLYHFLCSPFFCWFPHLCTNSSTIWFSWHPVCLLNGPSWSRALISPASSEFHLFSCLFKLFFHLFSVPVSLWWNNCHQINTQVSCTSLALNLLLSDTKHPFPFLLFCFILFWTDSYQMIGQSICPPVSFLISERFAATLISHCSHFTVLLWELISPST